MSKKKIHLPFALSPPSLIPQKSLWFLQKFSVSGARQSSNFSVIREIPVIVIGAYTNGNMVNEPLLSLQVDIAANRNYTTYMIGNTWSDNSLRALTVED